MLSITSSPSLYPAFDSSISDYVIRCDGAISVSVAVPSGTTVSVDSQPAGSGRFAAVVDKTTGESFTIVTQVGSATPSTSYVRCLPTDFPSWTASRTGTTQAEFYLSAPIAFAPTYPTIFDNNGVPVWWGPKTNTVFFELLGNGDVAWTKSDQTPAEVHGLDGSLIDSITTTGGPPDDHDLLLLPNGDYVMTADTIKYGVDLSGLCVNSTCGPSNTSVIDPVIEELTPAGSVVWSWDAAADIPPGEMDPQWYSQYITGGSAPYDVYHWNSVDYTGTGFLLSFRHLDAVYDIDQASGNILWKLGGSARPESLTVLNDPVFAGGSHFGGQHDARLNPDGTSRSTTTAPTWDARPEPCATRLTRPPVLRRSSSSRAIPQSHRHPVVVVAPASWPAATGSSGGVLRTMQASSRRAANEYFSCSTRAHSYTASCPCRTAC